MSQKRPDLLPEEKPREITKPNLKAKQGRSSRTVLWIFILLLLFAFGTISVVIIGQPEAMGLARISDLQATDEAVTGTLIALQATSDHLGTQVLLQQNEGMNLQNTLAALDYRESLISAQETEQFVNRMTTQTAISVQNFQQATQSALNFAATQQALQQIGTQVQIEFQATQTAISGGMWTPEPTLAPNVLIIDEGIINRLETGNWEQIPISSAWTVSDSGGLVAQMNNATLVTRFPVLSENYTNVARITPISTNSFYDVVVGVKDSGQALGLRLTYNGSSVTDVAFFTFESANLANGLFIADSDMITTLRDVGIVTQELNIAFSINGSTVTAIINDRPVLTSEISEEIVSGRAGIQVPAGVQVQRFTQITQ